MKKAIIKPVLTVALFFVMFFAFAMGGASLVRVSAETEKTTGFKMISAQARLEEPYGLRFKAQIGQTEYESLDFENGDYLGMLIIPELYLEYFADELTEGENDYVTVLEAQNVFVANVKPIIAYEDGDYYGMNGVLGNVKYDNLNVDFVGIAYMCVQGNYIYADFTENEGILSRSIGRTIAMTLADGFDDVDGVASNIYSLSLSKKLGKTEQDAKAIASKKLSEGLEEKQVVNFDDETYLQLLSNEENFTRWTSPFASGELNIVEIDGKTALELKATNYRALTINFVKPVIVTEKTVVNISIKTTASPLVLVNYDSLSGPVAPSRWSVTSYLVTDLGYEVGDLMTSVQLMLHHATESYYIDEITVTERVDLTKALQDVNEAGYGELANYNHSDYVLLNNSNANGASITADGKFAIKAKWSSNFSVKTYIPFARSFTVREGDKLVINMNSGNINIDKKDGSHYTNNTGHYGYDETITLSSLGYSVGDTVDCLTISGSDVMVYVNYVKLVNDKANELAIVSGLKGYQIANFDNNSYKDYVSSGTIADGKLVTDKKETITISLAQPKTVTANDYVALWVKETGWMQVNGQYVTGPSSLQDGDYNWYNAAERCNGFFVRAVDGYQLVILPISVAKYTSEQTVTEISIYNNTEGNQLSLDWIEIITLSSSTLTRAEAIKEYYDLKLAYTASQVYPEAISASIVFNDEKTLDLIGANPSEGNGKFTKEFVESEQAVKITSFETGYLKTRTRIYLAKPITLTANTKIRLNVKVDMDISKNWHFEFMAFGEAYKFTSLTGAKAGEYVTVTLETNATNETWNLFNSSMHGQELSYLELRFGEDFKSISIKSITVVE